MTRLLRVHRWRCSISALSVAGLAAASLLGLGATNASATESDPPTGSYLGAALPPHTTTAFPALDSAVGRPLDMQRVYTFWDAPLPAQLTWDVANSVIPALSIASTDSNGKVIQWSSIASGADDSAIVSQADKLKALGVPVLLSLDHEPETDTQNGTAAQYVAAYQHYVDVFRAQGATNVVFVAIFKAQSFNNGVAAEYYPGDSYVEWVGADGYNGYGCFSNSNGSAKWLSFASIFQGFDNFATAHDKPMLVAEFASTEYPNNPSMKAQWIAGAESTIKQWPLVKAALYFDAPGSSSKCDWPLSSSQQAMSAFVTMAQDPYFNPAPRPVLSVSPSSGTGPLSVSFDGANSVDLNHTLVSWSLDFGDGTPVESGSGAPPSAVSHTYAAGSWTATLTVTDNVGLSNFTTQPVTATAS